MVPVPRGQVGRESNKFQIEPLDELLARAVPRFSHRHHVVLRAKVLRWGGAGGEWRLSYRYDTVQAQDDSIRFDSFVGQLGGAVFKEHFQKEVFCGEHFQKQLLVLDTTLRNDACDIREK